MKLRFESAPKSKTYAEIAPNDWQDWRWQMRMALRKQSDFERVFELSEGERKGFEGADSQFKVMVTPYYAGLSSPTISQDPVRRIFMPQAQELEADGQQM